MYRTSGCTTQSCASNGNSSVPFSEVLAGLSYALDLTGQRPGHAVRSCLIGLRIEEAISLPVVAPSMNVANNPTFPVNMTR